MYLKSLLLTTSLLAGAASALPTAQDLSARALCTPQDHSGFTVRINSTDDLNDKIVSISGDVVGVDLPTTDSVIWPYSDGKKIFMPGPGYKYLIPGYLYSTTTEVTACGKQLKFSKDLPTTGVAETDVFTTSCDLQGTFYLAVEYDWSWKACPRVGGDGWTIHRDATREGCRDVKLKMIYGPPV
ncbi:hypothetical protein H072_8461 [Dactylellina haptotyla CBS 200.50]|uniref:Ubiquitin 3 binding protein But2 C-terminal domain-containing protein n=1 Tax=Dactylellina haptotyla (strain CBS 200.50) TaxID=1284197 RepID=S8BRM9_DACHA|nr:hypothetical protein H072_8461 [Dactylellina haptotyla CBS 200.50]